MEETSENQVETSPIIDCGVASEETKGAPFGFLLEFGPPPYDKAFVS